MSRAPFQEVPVEHAPEHILQRYKDFHWGVKATKVLRIPDPLFPHLVGIGLLKEIELDIDGRHLVLGFPSGSHIAFDPEHPVDRIYIVVPPKFQAHCRYLFANNENQGGLTATLSTLARYAPGCQGDHHYPRKRAMWLGWATHCLYHTEKKGDGWSDYIHHLGEVTDQPPGLAADVDGRFWLVGGNYTCPNPGITD